MKVLFCSDAMVVDGVTSFVFHLHALKNRVAVLGGGDGAGAFSPVYGSAASR